MSEPTQETVKCALCAQNGMTTEAIRRIIETGDGVCRGHVIPTLLAGYGTTPIRWEDDRV